MTSIKPRTNIQDLFDDAKHRQTYLKVCAPMVRYSKLQFRSLVRKYGVDLSFSPMTLTESFCRSEKARQIEFSTDVSDTPVIAQFAANDLNEYISAAEMIYPYVDGIDLNCGCPQSWAMQCGYGSALLKSPEIIKDLTSTVRRNMPNSFSVSVKLRVQKVLSETIELCRQLEHCGVTFLTVHGRTPSQGSCDASDVNALAEVKRSLSIPLIANGDCRSLRDADEIFEKTGCDGVMSARGILSNPTLFSGNFDSTPLECVQNWIDICSAAGDGITFQNFHHHFTFMMEKLMRKQERVTFNRYTRKEQVFQHFDENYDIRPRLIDSPDGLVCDYDDSKFRERLDAVKIEMKRNAQNNYDPENSKGKYFASKTNNGENASDCDSENDESLSTGNLFGDD